MSQIQAISPSLFAPDYSKIKQSKEIRKKSTLHSKKNEMPIYASFKKASYTIEAAVVLPLFITLMVFGMFLFRLLQVESGIQRSIDYASRTMAVTLGNVSNDGQSNKDVEEDVENPSVKGELSEAALIASTIALAGVQVVKEDVPLIYIDGGATGFNFLESTAAGNYIDLKVNYTMSFPVGLLGNFKFDVSQRARTRKWVGYDKAENQTDGTFVYMAEHSEVYHTNYYCTYLNPSVKRILKEEVDEKRNKGGAKYYQCKRCKGAREGGFLYITDYGTAYHKDVACTEIRHNIKKVSLDSVKETMRCCSKCGGEK